MVDEEEVMPDTHTPKFTEKKTLKKRRQSRKSEK